MFDYLLSSATADNVWMLIVLTGVVTYLTRSGGYVVLSRFGSIHPRVQAALEAVPGAVLVTIVLPAVLNNGVLEIVAMAAAALASLRFSAVSVLLIGMVIVVTGRYFGL